MLAGPLFALPFLFLSLVSGGRWMGLGDAKLTLALGWLLGAGESVTAFLLSFWIGTVVVVSITIARATGRVLGFTELLPSQKTLTMKTEVPFAPFLILGALVAFSFSLSGTELLTALSAYAPL
jgi:prepilin signal peptidase PulO-like enzyme (type II secretory pathway)